MTNSSRSLEGRCGLVLGVSRMNSAGFACAEYLSSLGARLAVSGRATNMGQVTELADRLGALPVAIDAANEDTYSEAIRRIEAVFGRLDFVLHTLVAAPPDVLAASVLELSRDDLAYIMDVSVRSLLVAVRVARPLLRRSDAPRIVALTSAGADHAIQHYHCVGMAKAALNATIRYIAAELGSEGVLCNALSFSMIPTDTACKVIGPDTTARTVSYLARRSMTGAATTLADVATTAAFLLSGECRNLTGQIITVDGGFSGTSF